MTKDNLRMLKIILVYDGLVILLSLIVTIIFAREYTVVLIVGTAVAFFNYLMNSVITEYSMKVSKGAAWILLGAVARIAIAGAFAFILYQNNRYNIIAYITGYTLHYAAMVISSASLRSNRKREGE